MNSTFKLTRIRRDQRAVCFAPLADRRPCPPLDDARSASQTARSSRACMVQGRRSGGLPSAARRRALRSGCDSLNSPVRLRSTFPARRPQTEASSRGLRRCIVIAWRSTNKKQAKRAKLRNRRSNKSALRAHFCRADFGCTSGKSPP